MRRGPARDREACMRARSRALALRRAEEHRPGRSRRRSARIPRARMLRYAEARRARSRVRAADLL